ncbi:hypothetical protein EM47_003750 [Vibrio parahaemolyticus]|nr:hypothetical protein EM47_003750 [Vibrio parahaemolyticus]
MIYACTKVVRIKIVAPQCDNSIAYSAQFLSKSQFVLCNDWNKVVFYQFVQRKKVGIKRKIHRNARE